jgi:hypothetical protein
MGICPRVVAVRFQTDPLPRNEQIEKAEFSCRWQRDPSGDTAGKPMIAIAVQ